MAHFNVIVLITPKISGGTDDATLCPNLWTQPYIINGKTNRGKIHHCAKVAVERQLAPYSDYAETKRPAIAGNCMGWDFYKIGGRWTGQFVAGYDPTADTRNLEPCWVCDATGRYDNADKAHDERLTDACERCDGTGLKLKLSTRWVEVEGGDIAPVKSLPRYLVPDAIVTPDGLWHECEQLFAWLLDEPAQKEWETVARQLLEQNANAVAVNVDIHN